MNVLIVVMLFLLVILVNLDFVRLVVINIKMSELKIFYNMPSIVEIGKLFLPSLKK